MRLVIQRVNNASVIVDNQLISEIDKGLVILVGFETGDKLEDIPKMCQKIYKLRIFEDDKGLTNCSLADLNLDNNNPYKVLLVSQFTLCANTSKGHRPSFVSALGAKQATSYYGAMLAELNKLVPTFPGKFGADMLLTLTNNGPFTIII